MTRMWCGALRTVVRRCHIATRCLMEFPLRRLNLTLEVSPPRQPITPAAETRTFAHCGTPEQDPSHDSAREAAWRRLGNSSQTHARTVLNRLKRRVQSILILCTQENGAIQAPLAVQIQRTDCGPTSCALDARATPHSVSESREILRAPAVL